MEGITSEPPVRGWRITVTDGTFSVHISVWILYCESLGGGGEKSTLWLGGKLKSIELIYLNILKQSSWSNRTADCLKYLDPRRNPFQWDFLVCQKMQNDAALTSAPSGPRPSLPVNELDGGPRGTNGKIHRRDREKDLGVFCHKNSAHMPGGGGRGGGGKFKPHLKKCTIHVFSLIFSVPFFFCPRSLCVLFCLFPCAPPATATTKKDANVRETFLKLLREECKHIFVPYIQLKVYLLIYVFIYLFIFPRTCLECDLFPMNWTAGRDREMSPSRCLILQGSPAFPEEN